MPILPKLGDARANVLGELFPPQPHRDAALQMLHDRQALEALFSRLLSE